MAFRIDQAGLAAGTPGRARTDGLATGALVTLTNTSGGTTTFRLLWVPVGDTTAVASLAPTGPGSDIWTFSPTPSRPGTYRIQLIRNLGQPGEVREERVFRVRTPNRGLIIPAFNESADPLGNLLNNGPAVVEASADNALDYAGALAALDYAGWFRAKHELIMAADVAGLSAVPRFSRLLFVDPLTAATTRDGSAGNPFNSLIEAHAVINAAAAGTAWVVILQAGQSYSIGAAALPTGRHVTYTTWQSAPVTTDSITETTITGTITVATGWDLCFRGVNVTSVTFTGVGRVVAYDCRLAAFTRASGTAGEATIVASRCNIDTLSYSANADNAFSLEAYGCTFSGAGTVSTYRLLARGCAFTAAATIEARFAAEVYDSVYSAVVVLRTINTTGVRTYYLDEVSRASADAAGCTYDHANVSFVGRIGERSVTRYRFTADDFLETNTADWAVNAAAPVAANATFPFNVASFDGTAQEGVGLTFAVPDGKTSITFEFWYTRSAGTDGSGFVFGVARKQAIGNGGNSFSWSAQVALPTLLPAPSAGYWRRFRARMTLAALSMEDRSYQVVQLLRRPADAADNIADDLVLREVIVELT